jgi:hypothetical protein
MVMRAYSEGPWDAGGVQAAEMTWLPAPPGTSLGQMDAMSLFAEVTSALELQPVGVVTPWATRTGDMTWEEIPSPDTNIMLWGLTDRAIADAMQVTFGSPLPFVAVVTGAPLSTSDVEKMWDGTAYRPYETQAVYRQDDAKPVPTILFLHWGERIDIAELPKDVLAIEPRAAAVGGHLVFAAQIPHESSTTRGAPEAPFESALHTQTALPGPGAQPASPPPSPPRVTPTAQGRATGSGYGLPIGIGVGAAVLGFFLWRRK